jgi:hypothetical protein
MEKFLSRTGLLSELWAFRAELSKFPLTAPSRFAITVIEDTESFEVRFLTNPSSTTLSSEVVGFSRPSMPACDVMQSAYCACLNSASGFAALSWPRGCLWCIFRLCECVNVHLCACGVVLCDLFPMLFGRVQTRPTVSDRQGFFLPAPSIPVADRAASEGFCADGTIKMTDERKVWVATLSPRRVRAQR